LTPTPGLSGGQILSNSLGENCSEVGRCTDVYELKCQQKASRCAQVRVCDTGPVNDTDFSVTVIGLTPPEIKNQADLQFSGAGSCSPSAQVCRTSNGPLTVLVVIGEGNHQGGKII
jgi:hypothetical protein